MEEQDLREIGISDPQHRRKLLQAARSLPKVTTHSSAASAFARARAISLPPPRPTGKELGSGACRSIFLLFSTLLPAADAKAPPLLGLLSSWAAALDTAHSQLVPNTTGHCEYPPWVRTAWGGVLPLRWAPRGLRGPVAPRKPQRAGTVNLRPGRSSTRV